MGIVAFIIKYRIFLFTTIWEGDTIHVDIVLLHNTMSDNEEPAMKEGLKEQADSKQVQAGGVWHVLNEGTDYYFLRDKDGFAVEVYTSMQEAISCARMLEDNDCFMHHWRAKPNSKTLYTHRIRINAPGNVHHRNMRYFFITAKVARCRRSVLGHESEYAQKGQHHDGT